MPAATAGHTPSAVFNETRIRGGRYAVVQADRGENTKGLLQLLRVAGLRFQSQRKRHQLRQSEREVCRD